MREIILRQKLEKERFLKAPLVERDISEKFAKHIQQDIIKVITGARRCGKSVFSIMALRGFPFGYVNLDEKELTEAKNYDEILKYVIEIYGDIKYLFLDEVQNLEKWELWINSLQRRGYNLVITGSNAKLLSRELATHLTGRYIATELFPFSFKEFMRAVGFEFKEEYTQEEKGKILHQLKKYLEMGGFPEVVVKGFDYSYLQSLFDSIIFKDIVKRYKIRYSDDLYNLAKYLISDFSKEASFTNIKKMLNFGSVHTVQNYVRFLEETYLIFSIDRFSFKQKEQIKSPKKIYAIDTGLINSIAFQFSNNLGRFMENAVAVELLRRISFNTVHRELYYWKDNAGREVDFVIKVGTKITHVIQVCYDMEDFETKERELKALVNASKELQCDSMLVITWDYEGEDEVDGKKILYVPLWKWLML